MTDEGAVSSASVAVLMTCHNRREVTLRCLRSLAGQDVTGVEIAVYLVDDGCTDGTAAAVRAEFPHVRIITGTGQLFWSGGMRLAQRHALRSDPDFMVWLNDDVILESGALVVLLATHAALHARGVVDTVVVGAMRDPDSAETTYSGVVRHERIRRMRFSVVEPASEPIECETMHGNLVLVPRSVYRRLEAFDASFVHAMSDFDYGLRARAASCEVWLAPGHLGACRSNPAMHVGLDADWPLRGRVRLLFSPTGLPPRDWLRFTRRHGGTFWPGLFIAPYVRFLGRAFSWLRPASSDTA